MRKLNIGCGKDYMEGYINIDKEPSVSPDIVRDLEYGFPFDDNTVDVVIAKHFVEHIFCDAFVMNEIYRVCKKGAIVTLIFPTMDGTGACDWGHKSFWNLRKVHYLSKDNRANEMGLDCNFEIVNSDEREENEAKVIEVSLKVVK